MKAEIEVDIPKGWKAVAYRCPREGEYFLYQNGSVIRAKSAMFSFYIIVEKEKPVRRVFEFTGEVRNVNTGEYYMNETGELNRWIFPCLSLDTFEVWKEVTEEIENE